MYVCLCNGITDSQIRNAIQRGASSYKDVRTALGLGNQCGKCGTLTREILRESLQQDGGDQQLFYAVS